VHCSASSSSPCRSDGWCWPCRPARPSAGAVRARTVMLGLLTPRTRPDVPRVWAGVPALLRDARRLPKPLLWGRPRWPLTGTSPPCSAVPCRLPLNRSSLFCVDLIVGVLVGNLWEQLAWSGFVQRRTVCAFGPSRAAFATAAAFAGVHLPLAFHGAAEQTTELRAVEPAGSPISAGAADPRSGCKDASCEPLLTGQRAGDVEGL
jgi:hypothetical protein